MYVVLASLISLRRGHGRHHLSQYITLYNVSLNQELNLDLYLARYRGWLPWRRAKAVIVFANRTEDRGFDSHLCFRTLYAVLCNLIRIVIE
jgi:hypothetical protein